MLDNENWIETARLTTPLEPGITFDSAADVERYEALTRREEELRTQLARIEQARHDILRRAHWSLDAILQQDG